MTYYGQQNMAEVACASSESVCTSCSLTQMDSFSIVSQLRYENMPLACLRDVRDTWSPAHSLDLPVHHRFNHVSQFQHKL